MIFYRNDEIALIEQVRAMVEARYGEVSSDVSERVEDEEFDAYENAYATEKTEDYEATSSEEGAEATGSESEEGLENL